MERLCEVSVLVFLFNALKMGVADFTFLTLLLTKRLLLSNQSAVVRGSGFLQNEMILG